VDSRKEHPGGNLCGWNFLLTENPTLYLKTPFSIPAHTFPYYATRRAKRAGGGIYILLLDYLWTQRIPETAIN
jgi:hypothetical protein